MAWPLGQVDTGANKGLKQMMDQVNMSRLSHGVRAAAMMRRCWNESLAVARNRRAFGGRAHRQADGAPPADEAAGSHRTGVVGGALQRDPASRRRAGDEDAARCARILTPLLKFRTARDNIKVATGAMEMRGGNGYVEEWVNARLVRDAHLGVLWEGTSNINCDRRGQARGSKSGAHRALAGALQAESRTHPRWASRCSANCFRVRSIGVDFAERVAREGDESRNRRARARSTMRRARCCWRSKVRISAQGRGCAPTRARTHGARSSPARAAIPSKAATATPAQIDALLDDASVTLARAQALVA